MNINPNKCRSLLFTPAHIEKFWSKAISSEADILVLDLEDAVPQNKKEEARKNIPMLLKAKPSSRPLLLRVNNVKSLLFKAGDRFILGLVAGDKRCSLNKLKKILNEKDVSMASPEDVKDNTGYTIGGVSPVGHLKNCDIYVDKSLERFSDIFGAAGHPNAVFKIKCKECTLIFVCFF